ncbi:SWIM zinc finger family protein [Halalkalibacterium ligniniphilum]|uniref:SWIM zinc finger family protein n=1 Tax=Halalkalibacterium ligniniphilum TaxID=1134413 RepID=UPI000348E50E|nr:SWIM zinc finger family protein [Halalkalibacterium ligniniphilum]
MAETKRFLSTNTIDSLLDRYFQPHIARRGLIYAEKGYVTEVNAHLNGNISAMVYGSSAYDVSLAFEHFEESSCSCPYQGFCKHMAAVLYQLKKPEYHLDTNFFGIPAPIQEALERDAVQWYKQLVTSHYMSAAELERLVADMKEAVRENASSSPWFGYFFIVKAVYSLARHFRTFSMQERRFQHFFSAMSQEITHSMSHLEDADYRFFLETLLFSFAYDLEDEQAPWGRMLLSLIPALPVSTLKPVDQFLEQTLKGRASPVKGILAYSYVSLLLGREDTAIHLLQRLPYLNEKDVLLHFYLLKKRMKWTLISSWFAHLFPSKEGSFGSLQPIYDEMLLQLSDDPTSTSTVWIRWLHAPSFQRFQNLTKGLSKKRRQEIVEELLPMLKQQLDQPAARMTYVRLLVSEQRYEEGLHYFLKREKDPFRMPPEKQELLSFLETRESEALLPIYHQFVVRLIEKKTRPHYEEAIIYLRKLKHIYEEHENLESFHTFLQKLKKAYKSYRALLKELKQLEA